MLKKLVEKQGKLIALLEKSTVWVEEAEKWLQQNQIVRTTTLSEQRDT